MSVTMREDVKRPYTHQYFSHVDILSLLLLLIALKDAYAGYKHPTETLKIAIIMGTFECQWLPNKS